MVRKKLDIEKIEDKSRRQVTFTKRRQGLFKKAGELCRKCDAQIAIITFSLAGNIYAWGHPTVDSVVKRYKSYIAQNPDHNQQENNDHENNKHDMGLALSLSLPAGENDTEKKEGDKEKGLVSLNYNNNQEGEKKAEGHAAAQSKMMMASRALRKIDDLQMDELDRLMGEMEEMKKMVVDRANQMRSSSTGQVPSSKSA